MTITPVSMSAINNVAGIDSTKKSVGSGIESAGNSFEDILSSLNDSQNNSDGLVNQLATGGDVDLHDVMIGLEENSVNFQVALSIRDKLVSAYQEIMRMNV